MQRRMDARGRGDRRRRLRWGAALSATAVVVSGIAGGALSPAGAAVEDCSTVPWMDTSKSADERAEALLDASSQHQKYRWLNEQAANSPAVTTFSGVSYPAQVDCTPLVIYANGAEGVHSAPGTTAWPGPISIASSWNLELGEQKGFIHAGESFDNRKAMIMSPGVASGRTPLSGRTPEYFGEDPLLSGLMGAANVRGLQGNEDKPVMANPKHYVANEQELDRQTSSSNLDERTFRQVYDLPYEIMMGESDPESIMCSFNQINGTYVCEDEILTTSLRDKMGFDGYIVSDFGSVHSTAKSLNAGLDQELNRPVWYTPEKLDAALAAGEITQERIDEAAFYVARSYIRAGLFDKPVPDAVVPVTATDESRALARELAEQSAVLLKNEGDILPLKDEPLTVAVIGPTASKTATNGVSAQLACAQSFRGTRPVVNCDNVVDPLTSISQRVEAAGGAVLYDNGADVNAASIAAAQADIAIVFGYITMGEFSDITDIKLDSNGDALVNAIADSNDNTVVVLNTGTAVEMPWLDKVDAVLNGWYAGEQMGPALAGLLWGDVNPSGKLPMTFPKSLADIPTSTPEQYPGIFSDGTTVRPVAGEIRQVNYTEGLQVGYKWYDERGIDPLFEFGYGLSYTSFEYSGLEVEHSVGEDGSVVSNVAFTITNTGDVDGTEIPQVYLTLPDAANEPGKRLVAFDRVDLAAGESKRVEYTVDSSASNKPFSVWDVDADAWAVVDGAYQFSVGASSRNLPLTKSVAVGDVEIPELEITASVTTRCVAGKNILQVTAVNENDVPVAVEFDSAFGEKAFTSVAPDKNAFHGFTTRKAQLEAGEVTVSATGDPNGSPVEFTETVAYQAATCR